MLGDFIPGSLTELNDEEMFQIAFQKLRAVSRFSVNNFCTYCSNFDLHYRHCLHTLKLLLKFEIGRFYTRGRIMRLDELGQTFVIRLVIRL